MPLRRVLAVLALLAWSLVVVAADAVGDTHGTAPYCLAQPLYGSVGPCPG